MDEYGPSSIITSSTVPASPYAGGDYYDDEDDDRFEHTLGRTPFSSTRHGRRDSTATVVVPKQENVLVCVRVRPPAVSHSATSVNPAHLEEAWAADGESKTISLLASEGGKAGGEYRFDSVVTGSGNEGVYEEAGKDLIHSAMNGYDAVIFAYGQTASGKTFTLVRPCLLLR